MKLLVTGGCGFVGSNLAAQALRTGHELCVLDNLSRHGAAQNLAWLRGLGRFAFEAVDVRDAAAVEAAVRRFGPEQVFHLAGQVAMTTSLADPLADLQINAAGTLHLLQAVRRHAPEAGFVYASTNKVYGDLEWLGYERTTTRWRCPAHPHGFDETLPFAPSTPYGCSKGAADRYVSDWHHGFGLRSVVLRHSSMYGGHQYATEDQGWVGWFCSRAAASRRSGRAERFTVSGSGHQVRDLLHVDDVVRLYFGLAERIDAVAGRTFNVGGGARNSLSILELLGRLERDHGARLAPTHIAARASDQRVFVADHRALTRAIGWAPQVGIDQGLAGMMAWELERAGAVAGASMAAPERPHRSAISAEVAS